MNSILSREHIVVLIVAALLLAVWPLPGTMALRHLLLVLGSCLSLYVVWQYRRVVLTSQAWHLYVLMLFFVWLLVHCTLFAVNQHEQLNELRGDWLRTLLATIIGTAVGLLIARAEAKASEQIKIILIAGFAGTVLIFFLRYAYEIYLTGNWLHENFFMTPYKSKPALVIFGMLLIPHACIQLLLSLQKGGQGLRNLIAILGIFLVVFAFYFANTKNGFLMLFFTSVIFIFSVSKKGYKAIKNPIFLLSTLVLASLALVPVKTHIESNPAWRMLIADAKVAVDINEHPHWKNRKLYPLPVNEYGLPVNGSTYERLSWATAGIQLIQAHPMGYGLIHHSFGALAQKKWPDFEKNERGTRGATHSGWIDFTLGFGVPGLLLILLPLFVCFYRSLGQEGYWHEYIRWTIPTIFAAYTVTEVSSDHFIELLFFLVAMFCGITSARTCHDELGKQGTVCTQEHPTELVQN